MGQACSRRLALAEVLGVFLLLLWYIWQLRFLWPPAWIPILVLVLLSHACRGETPAALGFGPERWREPFIRFGPLAGLLGLALLALGEALGTVRGVRRRDVFLSLAMYCLWGFFQQYLLNAYFLNRLRRALPHADPRLPSALAAGLFSIVHVPNWFLMAVTLVGGYACVTIYLKYRSLYFLGVAHGIFGVLLYLVVPDVVSHHLNVGPKWFAAGR